LLEALEHDVARLGVGLQLRVEDLFFDDLVDRQLALDGGEQLGPGLLPALGRRLELGEQLLDLVVVGLEECDGVHVGLLVGWMGVSSGPYLPRRHGFARRPAGTRFSRLTVGWSASSTPDQ